MSKPKKIAVSAKPKLARRNSTPCAAKIENKIKRSRGRPCKKDSIPEKQLATLYRKGFTDVEVADFFGITEQTLNNWKNKQSDFFESLKDWKLVADGKVERSLYQRALGGKWGGKHYPPDTTAMIFWLKNRRPAQWRDRMENAIELSDVNIKVKLV